MLISEKKKKRNDNDHDRHLIWLCCLMDQARCFAVPMGVDGRRSRSPLVWIPSVVVIPLFFVVIIFRLLSLPFFGGLLFRKKKDTKSNHHEAPLLPSVDGRSGSTLFFFFLQRAAHSYPPLCALGFRRSLVLVPFWFEDAVSRNGVLPVPPRCV